MTVADRIKAAREAANMSQEELARRIGLKDKSSITKIEKSGDKVTLKNVEKISVALGCPIPYLMGWDALSKDEEEAVTLFRLASPDIQEAVLKILKAKAQHPSSPD